VLRELQRSDPDISDAHLRHGLANARWPGRLEWARWDQRDILIDGAHNPDAALALAAYLEPFREKKTISGVHWIVGMSASKDAEGAVRAMVRPGDVVECVSIKSLPRRHQSAPTSRIRRAAEAVGAQGTEALDLQHALRGACAPAEAEAAAGLRGAARAAMLPVLCGSLHLVADFRQLLALRAGGAEGPSP